MEFRKALLLFLFILTSASSAFAYSFKWEYCASLLKLAYNEEIGDTEETRESFRKFKSSYLTENQNSNRKKLEEVQAATDSDENKVIGFTIRGHDRILLFNRKILQVQQEIADYKKSDGNTGVLAKILIYSFFAPITGVAYDHFRHPTLSHRDLVFRAVFSSMVLTGFAIRDLTFQPVPFNDFVEPVISRKKEWTLNSKNIALDQRYWAGVESDRGSTSVAELLRSINKEDRSFSSKDFVKFPSILYQMIYNPSTVNMMEVVYLDKLTHEPVYSVMLRSL
jgi:hypothetical protein